MGALRLLAALLAALRCLRLAIPCRHPSVRSCASSGAAPHRPGRCSAGVPPALPSWRQRALPGSWAHPLRICPALRPRPGLRAKPSCGTPVLPPLNRRRRPQRSKNLSRLNHTASAVAVYALPSGSPLLSARLASGCQLRSTGWGWLPTGWLRKVLMPISHLPPSPGFAGFAWRDDPILTDAGVWRRRSPRRLHLVGEPPEPPGYRPAGGSVRADGVGHRAATRGTGELRHGAFRRRGRGADVDRGINQ